MTDEAQDFGYDPTADEPIPITHPHYFDTLPTQFSVTAASLPPVGQQGTATSPGSPGSCAAWASTYGLATFTAANTTQPNRPDPSTPAGQASPAFIYIQVLKEDGGTGSPPTCGGSQLCSYFNILVGGGTPSMEAAPYYADCPSLWNDYGDSSPSPQESFQIGPVSAVSTDDLESVRQVLASDRVLAYGTRLYTDWHGYKGDPSPYAGSGIVATKADGSPVGHCLLLIGYDDTAGAVRIQNSQGTGWGDDGYVTMEYSTFQALAQGVAFYVP